MDFNIKITSAAEKNINRFKTLSAFEVEDIVRDGIDEEFCNFLEECDGGVCHNIYNDENDITIFTEVDGNDISIVRVCRGDKQFEGFEM